MVKLDEAQLRKNSSATYTITFKIQSGILVLAIYCMLFCLGLTAVKTSTHKDGHTFVLHVLDPMNPKEDAELSELLRPPESYLKKSVDSTEKSETEATEKTESKCPLCTLASYILGLRHLLLFCMHFVLLTLFYYA